MSAPAKGKRRKPKFQVGQVVAVFLGIEKIAPECVDFHKIKGFHFDGNDEIRYTFVNSRTLCPVEEILRPLTNKEATGQ